MRICNIQAARLNHYRVFVLLEHAVDDVPGVKQLPTHPKSDALKASDSKFASKQGLYYQVDDIPSLGALISKYLNMAEAPQSDVLILMAEFEEQIARSMADSIENRRKRLNSAPTKPRKIKATTSVFVRNPDVVAEVLHRASGSCEGCNSKAPFSRRLSGVPYLEVHHKTPLAQGSDDTVQNATALCPNCHRERHYG